MVNCGFVPYTYTYLYFHVISQWLDLDPFAPRSEYGSSWGNQSENVAQESMHQHASQFSSDTYPPPPPG